MMLTNTRTSRRTQTSLNASHPTPPRGGKASPSRLAHTSPLWALFQWQSLLVGHWLDVIQWFLVVISLIKNVYELTSLSAIQQLSQLPLLHDIRYTTNRPIQLVDLQTSLFDRCEIFGRSSALVWPRLPKLRLRPNILKACSVHLYWSGSLPPNIRTAPTSSTFKNLFKTYLLLIVLQYVTNC